MDMDKELLDILACPQCKTSVRLEDERLVCGTCGRRYPIRDGIPIMLLEEAEMPSGESKGDAGGRGGGGGEDTSGESPGRATEPGK